MSRWQLQLGEIEGAAGGPVFQRIARAVIDEVRRGRLRPGQRLPGSRALAGQLGVHRNTVLAALDELTAQGWLRAEAGRGTFVSESLPEAGPGRRGPLRSAARFALPPSPGLIERAWGESTGRVLRLSSGTPDARLFPVDELARTWRRVLRRSGAELLSYGDPAGYLPLRRALAEMVGELRGVAASSEHVLVTRGSQMALDLCARGLLRPGDVVAVEALGYRPAWEALRLAGATLVPIPVDGEGLDVEALASLLARQPVRAVYTTPHHQYPTTVTMSPARRLALLALARRHRLLVIEDDYDHEFHYEGRPVLPLASEDDGGAVVYLGTLSKVLAPGLRLGFVVAAADVVARLSALRGVSDRQGDQAMEAVVAEWIEQGELPRHVRKMRQVYRERRDVLAHELRARLGATLSFEVPDGGISLWARVAPGVALARWLERCAERSVVIGGGQRYTFDERDPHALRLVFSPLTPAELRRAVATMASCVPGRVAAGASARRAAG